MFVFSASNEVEKMNMAGPAVSLPLMTPTLPPKMTNLHPQFLAGYNHAETDNSPARVGLIEAIGEARREASDPRNTEETRASWKQKADRWQSNLDATTRAVRMRFGDRATEGPR